MGKLMITIVAGVCLCVFAAGEGNDLKSLARPQTFSCELRDVRLTRAIDEMSSGKETKNRVSEVTTIKRTQSGSSKGTVESSSSNVTNSHEGCDERIEGRINAEGGLKWGLVPSGTVSGGVHLEGSAGTRRSNDQTNSDRSGTEVSVTDMVDVSSSRGQEKMIEGSDKSRLGIYRLVFSVALKNSDVNDELQIDSSRMYAKLRGPGLTGVISVPCSEQGEFTLGAEEKSFEFAYSINDERTLDELINLDKRGQLGQLTLSQTGADIPVVSKKSGKSVLSEQGAIERRNPSTAVSIEFGGLQKLPSWRVSRRHTAKSGRRGTFVTLREALQGIGLLAVDFSDTLPEQIFEFSKDGVLVKVLDSEMLEIDNGHYQVLALRLKDHKGTTSLTLPLSGKLDLTIADYSEIAIIAFTFDEFAEWAVQFPSHFSSLKNEIESWLAVINPKALSAFKKNIDEAKRREETKQHEIAKKRRDDIDKKIVDIRNQVAKLRGGDTSLKVIKFVPPNRDTAYDKVKAEQPWWLRVTILSPGVAWKNDAQRVIVVNEYLGETKLLSTDEVQKEIDCFDKLKNVIEELLKVIVSRRKTGGEDRNYYIEAEKTLLSIKEKLETQRTRYLSYEVVSPRLYEAHCYLFAGIKDGGGISSFDTVYPELGEKYRKQGIQLLVESCRNKWLYSCASDVRRQFLDIVRYMKEKKVEKNEYEWSKEIMEAEASECNDPSTGRSTDRWILEMR